MFSDMVDGISDEINRLGHRVSGLKNHTVIARGEPAISLVPTSSSAQPSVPLPQPANISSEIFRTAVFTGNRSDRVESWIAPYEMIGRYNKWSHAKIVSELTYELQDIAETFFLRFLSKPKAVTWKRSDWR